MLTKIDQRWMIIIAYYVYFSNKLDIKIVHCCTCNEYATHKHTFRYSQLNSSCNVNRPKKQHCIFSRTNFNFGSGYTSVYRICTQIGFTMKCLNENRSRLTVSKAASMAAWRKCWNKNEHKCSIESLLWKTLILIFNPTSKYFLFIEPFWTPTRLYNKYYCKKMCSDYLLKIYIKRNFCNDIHCFYYAMQKKLLEFVNFFFHFIFINARCSLNECCNRTQNTMQL